MSYCWCPVCRKRDTGMLHPREISVMPALVRPHPNVDVAWKQIDKEIDTCSITRAIGGHGGIYSRGNFGGK
jgi:hypothetical protein